MDYYQQLAEVALAQCPPAYTQVQVSAELDEDYSEIGLQCSNGQNELETTDYPVEATAAIHRALDGIREEMARLSGAKWTRCVFQVFADGTFKLDVSY